MAHYDYLNVGAGLYGAVYAREAAKKGRTSLVIDKRPHIAGNVYTEKVEGINVHVYGALRGRAIAGGGNNMEARVFALNFDPELVSIAGYYAVRDGLGQAPIGRAVQVRLIGEQMRFDPLG